MSRSKAEPVALGSLEASSQARIEELLVESRPRLFRVALLMLGSRADAEDATQKALLRALGARGRFRGESGVYTWLYRILVNICKDHYKARARAGRWIETAEPAALDREPDPAPATDEALAARDRDERVRRALDGLEPRLREILVMRHFDELSYQDIAAVLEVPIGTVRSRLAAARERLRERMQVEEAAPVRGR